MWADLFVQRWPGIEYPLRQLSWIAAVPGAVRQSPMAAPCVRADVMAGNPLLRRGDVDAPVPILFSDAVARAVRHNRRQCFSGARPTR
jgi:hypothetical protein